MCSKRVVVHNQKIKNVNKSALTGRKYTKPSKIIMSTRRHRMSLLIQLKLLENSRGCQFLTI